MFFLLCKNASEETSDKPPMSASATLPATTEDESFGSRKARSSFGKGFFKIRGAKKTAGTLNLGKHKPHDVADESKRRLALCLMPFWR